VKPCLSIFKTLLVIMYICLDLCIMGREMDFLHIDDFDIWVQVPLVLKVELPHYHVRLYHFIYRM